jgi:cytochrome c biogenesis protein CcmG/thiol:disulfide interchange protein DsbE
MRRAAQGAAVSVVLALLALLIWDVAHSSTSKVPKELQSGKVLPAPAFTRSRVGSPGTLSLAELRGKVVVLNFWQSYCPPCTHEAPTVSAVSKKWAGKNVVFVGVDEQDLPGPALKFMKRFEISYPVIADDGPLIGHYGVTGYPETFFIDRHGRLVPAVQGSQIIGHIVGAASAKALDENIRNALQR